MDVVKRSLSDDFYSTHIEDILTEVHSKVARRVGEATPSDPDNTGVSLSQRQLYYVPYIQSLITAWSVISYTSYR